ncbi:hypothetical protein CHS0354_028907 [Potamilus streckersoni]|uniref:Uncharacterized protein n=1 Tax=Potamilus streckersoni TaxID=2493646 RepID=A0AAE0SB07_9BIVA|nr:hypothetical protein CHS0354_028907 [Potamilus streckersoni]
MKMINHPGDELNKRHWPLSSPCLELKITRKQDNIALNMGQPKRSKKTEPVKGLDSPGNTETTTITRDIREYRSTNS